VSAKRPPRRKPRSAPNSRGGAAPPAGPGPAAVGSPPATGGVGPSPSKGGEKATLPPLDQILTAGDGGEAKKAPPGGLPPLDAILANATAETRTYNREQLASSPYEWVSLDADKSSGSMSAGKGAENENAPPSSLGAVGSSPADTAPASAPPEAKSKDVLGGKTYDELEEEMHDLKVKMRKCDRLSKLRKRGRNLAKPQQTLLANKSRHQARLEEIKKIMRQLKS